VSDVDLIIAPVSSLSLPVYDISNILTWCFGVRLLVWLLVSHVCKPHRLLR
jgi:hypothetical protein